jgi:hypothetical protein
MVARRPDQGIGDAPAFEDLMGRRQGAIHASARGNISILVKGREGIDTVVSRQNRGLLWRPGFVSNGKYIRIKGFPFGYLLAGPLEVTDEPVVMNRKEVSVRKIFGLYPVLSGCCAP